MHNRLDEKVVEEEENSILIKIVVFHQPEVDGAIQVLLLQRCHVGSINPTNIISGGRICCKL